MLAPWKSLLASKRIVLASQSPRRAELLGAIDFPFEVVPSNFEEDLEKSSFKSPAEYVKETALRKAKEVAARLKERQEPFDLIIGCDTVVVHEDRILEKPKDKEDAVATLSRLSGSSHYVVSGVILMTQQRTVVFDEQSEVLFSDIPEDVVKAYVESGEPMDKAGGYGIQGTGGTFVKEIKGCYFNIVGFPIHRFCEELVSLLQGDQLSAA